MSQENVDLFLASIGAYNAGDIDALMGLCAPDIEAFPALPESRPLHGREEYRRFAEEANSAWVGARFETIEALPLGADRVLYRGEWGGEGRASGIDATTSTMVVATIRDGLIARVEFYFDHDQALKAVGLAE